MSRAARFAAALCAGLILAVYLLPFFPWTRPPAPAPVPQGLRLVPAPFARLPGWEGADPRAALTAFSRSCAKILAQQPAAPMGGAGYAGTVGDWQGACRAVASLPVTAASGRAYFEAYFVPVQILDGAKAEGLFTGYFEPLIRLSAKKSPAFATPIYARPADLITADLGQFRATLAHQSIAGRLNGQRLVPYPGRASIETNGLAGAKILAWTDDPISFFFLQIQGSGRGLYSDGRLVRLSYDGQNGRPYTAIGRTLIRMGALTKAQVSLPAIRNWLVAHPGQAAAVMRSDDSYVFFRQAPLSDPALGAEGTGGVPLTGGASLAVDAKVHPLGAPFFLAAPVPTPSGGTRAFANLLIAQDTGGAISGAVRGDVYWGAGPDAAAIAGAMKSHGRLYVLLPKALAAKLGPPR